MLLEQIAEYFGAAITKKPLFLPKKGQKMPLLGLKQCFWGLNGQLQGPPPHSDGAGLKTLY